MTESLAAKLRHAATDVVASETWAIEVGTALRNLAAALEHTPPALTSAVERALQSDVPADFAVHVTCPKLSATVRSGNDAARRAHLRRGRDRARALRAAAAAAERLLPTSAWPDRGQEALTACRILAAFFTHHGSDPVATALVAELDTSHPNRGPHA